MAISPARHSVAAAPRRRGSGRVGATLVLMVVLGACGDDNQDPKAAIRALIVQAEQAAEAHEIGDLKPLVAASYRDTQGHDRDGILRLAQFYLLQNRSLHLFSTIKSIALDDPETARATVLVAVSTTPVEDATQLLRLRAELLRFELRLALLDGARWRVTTAQWRRAGPEDFL